MIPVRDDTERERVSFLALGAATLTAVTALVLLAVGEGLAVTALLIVNASAIWIFGGGAEARTGGLWVVLALLLGAGGGAAIAIAAGAQTAGPIAAAASTGAAFEMVALHLLRVGGSRILTLVLVPMLAGIAELPAKAWAAVWAACVVVLAVLGAFGS